MSTIIRRSSDSGDPRLPRVPFPEPGPVPKLRASVLAFQGDTNQRVNSLDDPAGGGVLTPGVGDNIRYVLQPSTGIPFLDLDSDMPSGANPTLYRTAGGENVRSMIVVGRVLTLTDAPNASPAFAYGQVLRASLGTSDSMSITGANHVSPGRLAARGGSQTLIGPEVPMGDLSFFAVVLNGNNSIVQVNGSRVTGPAAHGGNSAFVLGYTRDGKQRVQVVEAAVYSSVLTVAELEEKRAHYRALYQF